MEREFFVEAVNQLRSLIAADPNEAALQGCDLAYPEDQAAAARVGWRHPS